MSQQKKTRARIESSSERNGLFVRLFYIFFVQTGQGGDGRPDRRAVDTGVGRVVQQTPAASLGKHFAGAAEILRKILELRQAVTRGHDLLTVMDVQRRLIIQAAHRPCRNAL